MKKISKALLSAYARVLGRLGGKGGTPESKARGAKALNDSMTPEQRTARARQAGLASAKAKKRKH